MQSDTFKLFDDLGVMLVGSKEKTIEHLENWTQSNEAKELFSSKDLKAIRFHFNEKRDEDFISFSGFTICKI